MKQETLHEDLKLKILKSGDEAEIYLGSCKWNSDPSICTKAFRPEVTFCVDIFHFIDCPL